MTQPAPRPLNALQLAFHHVGELANPNSGELLTLAGPLDADRLREAVTHAVARHPLLNCTAARRWRRWVWVPAAAPLPIDLRIEHTDETDEAVLLPKLWRNLWATRLPADGRPVRFHYTQGPARSYLQICAPHTVTDARSGTRLAADIALAYTALSEGRAPDATVVQPLLRPPTRVFLGDRRWWQRLGLMAQAVGRLARELLTPGSGLRLPAPPTPGPTHVAVTRVSDALLTRTLAAARAHGATAHALFLLAIARARQDLLGPGPGDHPLRINDLATLRPYADRDLGDAVDVLVAPHQITLDPTWDDPTALRILTARIRTQKAGGILPELYRLALYGQLARILPTRHTAGLVFRYISKTDLAVTNPGRVSFQDALARFGPVPVDDFINFPHLLPPAKIILVFTTFRGTLRLIQLSDPAASPDGVEATLAHPLLAHLDRLVTSLEATAPAAKA